MGTTRDHRKCAEECVAMARASDDDRDKVLWLTLAQSWVRLAEHVARSATAERGAHGREDVFAAHSFGLNPGNSGRAPRAAARRRCFQSLAVTGKHLAACAADFVTIRLQAAEDAEDVRIGIIFHQFSAIPDHVRMAGGAFLLVPLSKG